MLCNQKGGGVKVLTCKPNFDLLLWNVVVVTWCKQPQATLCTQKMAEGWMTSSVNLTSTCYYFETLLSRDVNSPRRWYVNNDVDSVTPCLTYL